MTSPVLCRFLNQAMLILAQNWKAFVKLPAEIADHLFLLKQLNHYPINLLQKVTNISSQSQCLASYERAGVKSFSNITLNSRLYLTNVYLVNNDANSCRVGVAFCRDNATKVTNTAEEIPRPNMLLGFSINSNQSPLFSLQPQRWVSFSIYNSAFV